MNNTKKVFLSHHSSTVELTDHLSKYLNKNGIETWYAPRDIRSGEQWDEAINEAIKSCRAVVLLFCEQADSSIQVKRELSLADRYKRPVFWIRIERVEPNNLSYFLTSTQWFDWLDMRDDTLAQLVNDLESLSTEKHESINETFDSKKQSLFSAKEDNRCSWAKGILAFDSARDAAECVARIYFSLAQNHPDSSVILPTGRSATKVFRAMMNILDEYEDCPFGEAHLISDTETFGVWSGHETSRTGHILDLLINPMRRKNKGPNDEQLQLLSGIYLNDDPVRQAQKQLRLYPPIVHAVSVSPLGEIIAYEVGTYNDIEEIIDDLPRIVEVGEHSKKYIDPDQPSKSILTIGMGCVMSSDYLLVLVFESQKANILKRLFNGPMTAGIPATLLRNHHNAYVITTKSIIQEAGIDGDNIKMLSPLEAAEWVTKE